LTTADDVAADEAYNALLANEARSAIWHAWVEHVAEAKGACSYNGFHLFREVDGELVIIGDIPPLPPDAEKAAAEELLCDGEPDVQGDEDGPELVWKTDPVEALARVRPRLIGSLRPARRIIKRPVRDARRPQRAARTRRPSRVGRVARTASSRGDPDDPEPARGRRPRRLAEFSRRAA
jgi:hypothetical protein